MMIGLVLTAVDCKCKLRLPCVNYAYVLSCGCSTWPSPTQPIR